MVDRSSEMEKNNTDETTRREKALESFLCFLYVGNENPYYKAKPWNDDNFHLQKQHMRSLEILASNEKTELVPLDKIKLAMDSLLIQRPETLMFALAMCARQKKSKRLRAAAYYFLTEHCKEWKYFVLFIKYASLLCKTHIAEGEKEGRRSVGWGRGWKNAVNTWYTNHDATDLAILVGRHKGRHGWTHKDILKLSHIDTLNMDVEKRVIVKYVLEGPKAASEECENDARARNQLDYLSSVADLRRCRDFDEAATTTRVNKFTIDHLHSEVLKSKEVWESLLYDMDIRSILRYFSKINKVGCFGPFSLATDLVARTLVNTSFIQWNRITPADVVPVLNFYEGLSEAGPTDEEDEAKVESERKKVPLKKRAEVTPRNEKIHEALCDALDESLSVDITDASKKSYVIAITRPGYAGRTRLYGEAGLSIAFPLLHRGYVTKDQTKIVVFRPREAVGAFPEITKDMNFREALSKLISPMPRPWVEAMPAGSIEWCCRRQKNFDVFVNVISEPPSKKSIKHFRRWKELSKSPDARLINVVINRGTLELKGDIWRDVLTIKGFDPHVPFIIEAYVRGLF